MSLTAVVCTFPQSPEDIIFAGSERGLFGAAIQAMVTSGAIENAVISTHKDLNPESRNMLQQLGCDIIYSEYAAPQQRIAEVFRELDLDKACILNGYSFLADPAVTRQLDDQLRHGKSLCCGGLESPFRYQCVLDRKTAEKLGSEVSSPLNPLKIHTSPALDARTLALAEPDASTAIGRDGLLWLLLTHVMKSGDATLADALISELTSGVPLVDACTTLFKNHGLDCNTLGTIHGHAELYKLCSLIREYVYDLRPRIAPLRKGRFLEVGFGDSPYSAFLSSSDFATGVAVEPFTTPEDSHFKANMELVRATAPTFENLLPSLGISLAGLDNLTFHCNHLETCNLTAESIDFCYSITVMEHVQTLPELLKEMMRVMAPGGAMLHGVDYTGHHFCEDHLFPFYAYSHEEWLNKTHTLNLLRHGDVVHMLKTAGFDVQVLRQEKDHRMPTDIHPDWSGYGEEDLTTAKGAYWCTKPLP